MRKAQGKQKTRRIGVVVRPGREQAHRVDRLLAAQVDGDPLGDIGLVDQCAVIAVVGFGRSVLRAGRIGDPFGPPVGAVEQAHGPPSPANSSRRA